MPGPPCRAAREDVARRQAPAQSRSPLPGLPMGHGLRPRLPTIVQRLVPHLAMPRMVRQPFDLLRQTIGSEPLERRHTLGM